MQYIKFLMLSFLVPASIFTVPRRTRVEVVNRTNQKAVVQSVTVIPQQTKAIITTELIALKQQGNNVFFRAIANDSASEMNDLIRKGFDINQGEMSPLLMAILLKKKNVINFLINNGAIIKESYIGYALKNRDASTAILLAGKINGLDKFYEGKCLLAHAIECFDSNSIISLIQTSSIENIKTSMCQSCGGFDAETTLKIFRELIRKGVNPNDLWFNFPWATYWSSCYEPGVAKIIQLLVESGANPNYISEQNQNISTPLFSCLPNLNAIKKLIELGADVNIKTGYKNDLRTPLSYILYHFAGNDNTEIISFLLEHGATL